VTDASLAGKGFKYLNTGNAIDYTYDKNGNLTADANKGISTIEYNYLNLPQVITFTGNRKISFVYDASGVKMRKIVNNNGTVTTYDYIDGIEYRANKLERVAHAEGAITRNAADAYEYEYVLRDHLGNTRVTFADGNNDGVVTSADIRQVNNYYPYGLNMEGNWTPSGANGEGNKYQYNGKELNDDFGLGWNDYGARFYDAAVGRWWSVDPLAEKYSKLSGYHFSGNNPIRFIDFDGRQFKDPNDEQQAKNARGEKWKGVLGKVAQKISNQLQKLANEAKESSGLLKAAADGIGQLIDDKNNNYRYENNIGSNSNVSMLRTDADGTVVIPYLSDANRIHETVHAIQHNNGLVKPGTLGTNMWKGVTIEVEIAAYSVQYAYQSSSLTGLSNAPLNGLRDINENWVRGVSGGIYNKLPTILQNKVRELEMNYPPIKNN
jgi:RHS repeat-associated protein